MKTQVRTRLETVIGPDHMPDKIYEGRGCDRCSETGYFGRVATFEFMKVTEGLQDLIMQKAGPGDLERCALEGGMVSMRSYTSFLLNSGVTTVSEAMRALSTLTN